MSRSLACGLFLSLAGLSVAQAAESARLEANIQVEVQMVSISQAAALTLVPLFKEEKTVEAANQRLQEMIAREEATLLAWPRVFVKNGGQSISETAEEYRYPVEFDPPQEPSTFGGRTRIAVVRPEWGENVPTAFSTLNLGPLLEVVAAAGADGRTIVLTTGPWLVRLLGIQRYSRQPSNLGIMGTMEQPEFSNNRVTTSFTVLSGTPVLLSVFVKEKPSPRVELFVLKATLLPGPPVIPPLPVVAP